MNGAAPLRRQKQAEFRLLPACRRRLCTVFAILLAVLLSAYPSYAGPAVVTQSARESTSGLPTLTTARQAHNLTSEEARRAYPIHLRGVVTYYDPSIGSKRASLFVHDSTGSIYAELPEGIVGDLSPGTLIDVRGVSGPGEFAPIVAHPEIKVIGHSPLPTNAPRPSLTRLKTGAEDSNWVEVEGVVYSAVEYEHNVTLQLGMEGGTVTVVMVKEAGAAYSSLIDAKVRIHANAGPTFNRSLQMIGVRLMCPNLSAIKILEAMPSDPFKLPPVPVDKLLRWDQVRLLAHPVHLRGKVTLQWPGSSVCIRDDTRGICAQTDQSTPLRNGELVDVVGFAGVEGSAPVLTDAVFRSAGGAGSTPVVPVTAEQALAGKYDAELVQIDGQLIGNDQASSDTTLLLTSGKDFFTAILPKSLTGSAVNTWKIGSKLRVTGICSVRLDTQRSAIGEGMAVPKSFQILMRSPQDVAILQRPSWWTPVHALVVLGLALTATLLVLAWVMVLRKRVEQQTILLRESEGRFRHMALHDALTGLATRLLLRDRLNTAVDAARRRQTRLALLIVDLDRFKDINDTFGHLAGDEVLRVTAIRLLEAVRKTDTVARMGGDEFVVLLADVRDPQIAESITAKIVAALAVPIPFEGRALPVSVSVGVCTASAGELDAEALLKSADAALYQAKASGRNRFQVFTPEVVGATVE